MKVPDIISIYYVEEIDKFLSWHKKKNTIESPKKVLKSSVACTTFVYVINI